VRDDSDAAAIITRFLKRDKEWIQKAFDRPLYEILAEFDQTAHKLAAPGCWINGFGGGASAAAFPDKVRRRAK